MMAARYSEAFRGQEPPGLDEMVERYFAVGPLTDAEIGELDQLSLKDRILWVQHRYGSAWPAALSDRRRRAPGRGSTRPAP